MCGTLGARGMLELATKNEITSTGELMDPNALARHLRDLMHRRDPLAQWEINGYLDDYERWLDMGGFPASEEAFA